MKCPACEAGSPTKKAYRIPYRRAKTNEEGVVVPYGPSLVLETTNVETIKKLKEQSKRFGVLELVVLDE